MATKKPKWVVEKEQAKKASAAETVWLFGLHAVRDALENPRREKLRLVVTKNAADKLSDAIAASGMEPEMADPRKFSAPLDPQSVHQGAALEVKPLDWGALEDVCLGDGVRPPRVLLLDRVTDPHNVGAILRSAEVFGASAVIAPRHHSAPETRALAKTASGALERQPYLRVRNLADAMSALQGMGYLVLGLDGAAGEPVDPLIREPSALANSHSNLRLGFYDEASGTELPRPTIGSYSGGAWRRLVALGVLGQAPSLNASRSCDGRAVSRCGQSKCAGLMGDGKR